MTKLNVGDTLPMLTVSTHTKKDVELTSLLSGKTVFWVLRYIGCTVCRFDVHRIKENYDAFKAKNASVVVVMQSDAEHVNNDLAKTNETLPFEIICDPDFKVYNTFSINPAESMEELLGDALDALKAKGAAAGALGFSHGDYEGNEQQLPAMFIADETGKVIYAHYAKNIMDMPTVEEVLNLL